MPTFRYRAARAGGQTLSGAIHATTLADAVERLRRQGLIAISTVETREPADGARGRARVSGGAASRRAALRTIGELAVLLGAGLPLDRALGLVVQNVQGAAEKAALEELHARVKEGWPLSRAMAQARGLFSPAASAMAEAGEANGQLAGALQKLADTLERAEALRQTIRSAMIYPLLLLTIATGVILTMLLFVVPQFEGLFSGSSAELPAATRLIVGASHAVRDYGLVALATLLVAAVAGLQMLKRPRTRRWTDRQLLRLPRLGRLLVELETARFARVLGSLVGGSVPLPTALQIAARSVNNGVLAEAVERVAVGLKRGSGLTGPLAATGLFPPLALSFLKVGEETAQLGPMLDRLADVLDQDVRVAIQRLITLLTPAITVLLGVVIATIIASLMTAILGFNDLAMEP